MILNVTVRQISQNLIKLLVVLGNEWAIASNVGIQGSRLVHKDRTSVLNERDVGLC
jgi:hypothetical protein